MKKIALIPIDNRPVCYTLPILTANINPEVKLFLPNRKFLGSLTKNADIEAIFEWLEDIQDVDYIVISADTLIYGGLIPSRRTHANIEEIEQKILRLRNILLKKRNCKTFLFSSIMRISNNNINEEEKEYWKDWGEKIFEYSYNLHRAELEGNDEAKRRAFELSVEIPKEILIDWLASRARNFEVNKMYLKLYDDGLIDSLIYSKDDCAKFGLNVKEAKYFEFEAETRKKVFVKTGADEIPLTLLARCFSDGEKVKIAPVYTKPDFIQNISKYEDISLEKSVISQIETAGAAISGVENADMILYVNNFEKEQGELVMKVDVPLFDGGIEQFDKPYFVVDVLNANGADNNFVKRLMEKTISDNFLGYAGWNTTGNSLGSAISAAISAFTAKNIDKTAFNKLQTVRFLDDWAYQANLREQIKVEKISNENEIKALFVAYENAVREFLKTTKYEIRYEFPWNRTFEIEVKI
ncbi:MAG: DUF4127 family protein [Candidatus Gastranaerophilaceae bacterium]